MSISPSSSPAAPFGSSGERNRAVESVEMVAELSFLAPVTESYKEESERKTEIVTLDLLGGRGDPDPADRTELDLELQVTAGWARRLVPLVCPLAHISIHFDFFRDLVLPFRSFPFGRESAFRIRKGGEILLLPYLHYFLRIPADRTTKPFTSNSASTNSLLTKLVHFSSDFALESFGFVGDGTDAFLILMKLRSSCSPNP